MQYDFNFLGESSRVPMPILNIATSIFAFVHSHVMMLLLGWIAIRIFYLFWFHPLANVPGPRIAALTDLWKAYATMKGRFSTSLHEQHVKYGDVVRIGPNEVSIIAPDDVRSMYGHRTEYLKGPFYAAFSVGGTGQFSERDPVAHGIRRSSVAAAYSLKHLTTLEHFCDTCTEHLLYRLEQAAANASVVDLSELMEWYAYDSVSGIGFGTFFGFLENGADRTGVLKMLATATRIISVAATLSNFAWILPTRLGSLLTSGIGGNKGISFLVGYGAKIIKDRQYTRENDPATHEETQDMLYRFMESTSSSNYELVNKSLLRNTLSIIIAGADTTKISMTAFLRYVYAHPPTVKRLRKEMDEAVASGNLSFPINYGQAARLEFLSACIKEATRLHPAVGMPLQRVVPRGGRVIGGRSYGAGTLVGMSPREVHYDSRAYGADADQWRPERWLEGNRSELEKFSLVFGQGSRVCLGKNISLMEMSKLLPTIVYHYDISIKNSEQPWKAHESWFVNQFNFFCTITKREFV